MNRSTLLLCTLVLAVIYFASLPNQGSLPLEPSIENLPISGLPIRLIIPTIDLSSSVEYVGLTSGGAMDTPKNTNSVAWFNLGKKPGEAGTAVMDGHYGWKDGKSVVFDNLSKLQKGDRIYVENDLGVTISFIVRDIKLYDSRADTNYIFNSDDGKSHLNLITCEGTWNKDSKSYSNRLVVFSDKE